MAITSMAAMPLRTAVPAKAQLLRWATGASAGLVPGRFSTGIDSPVNTASVTRNARLCIRSEALVAEIRLRTFARKMILASLAVLTALMGLAFINMALFAYLQSVWGPVWTPLAIGLINFALAAAALLAAMLVRPGPDLAMAEEVRKLSGSSLESASDSNVARLLIPAVISIVSAMRHRRDAKKT